MVANNLVTLSCNQITDQEKRQFAGFKWYRIEGEMFTTKVFIAAPLFPTDAALTGFILKLAVFKESTGINVIKHFLLLTRGDGHKKDKG
jgi:hypothetical protein